MVAANGARFHVAVLGEGPLVLLLHGFPQFWWTWRHQLPRSPTAGYRVARDGPARLRRQRQAAARLRPAHPRRGRLRGDPLARRPGRRRRRARASAAWSPGRCRWLHPRQVRRLVAVSMPHPRRLRRAHLTHARQVRASRHVLGYQAPMAAGTPAGRRRRRGRRDPAAAAGPGPASRTPRPRRATGRPRRSPASRTARWSPTAGRSGRSRAPTASASPAGWRSPVTVPDPAGARRPGPLRAAHQRTGLGQVRRGAVPLAPDARRRALPARGGPVGLHHGLSLDWLDDPSDREHG